jgi:hypothetical protein
MLFLILLCHAEYHLVAYLVNYLCSHCIHAQGFCSVFLATIMPCEDDEDIPTVDTTVAPTATLPHIP